MANYVAPFIGKGVVISSPTTLGTNGQALVLNTATNTLEWATPVTNPTSGDLDVHGGLGLYDAADNSYHYLRANEGLEYDGNVMAQVGYVEATYATIVSVAALTSATATALSGKVGISNTETIDGIKTFSSPVTVTVSVADTGIVLSSATNPRFSIVRGGVERLRLDAVGAIGTIGGSANGLVIQAVAGSSAGLSFASTGIATFTHRVIAPTFQVGSSTGPMWATDGTFMRCRDSTDSAFAQVVGLAGRFTNFIWVGGTNATNVHIYGTADGILELYNNAETGFGTLRFGGAGTSHPGLTRSSTQLQCTLANGSAWTSFGSSDHQLGSATGPIINTTGTQIRFRNSANTAYANGEMATCYASNVQFGGAGLNNCALYGTADGVATIYNAAQTGFTRFNYGGTTNAFPSIKRSGTILQARLADDSAFGTFQGKLQVDNTYAAGAVTPTGTIVLYDSTGTAYRVPCLI